MRLCGDAHGQLRDGGWSRDIHQARLSAVHLGPVSSSGVSMLCLVVLWSFPFCAHTDIGKKSEFGATPTVSFTHFHRLLNSTIPFSVPVADTSTELLFSPQGKLFRDSVWLCLDMRVARTSLKM